MLEHARSGLAEILVAGVMVEYRHESVVRVADKLCLANVNLKRSMADRTPSRYYAARQGAGADQLAGLGLRHVPSLRRPERQARAENFKLHQYLLAYVASRVVGVPFPAPPPAAYTLW